MEIHSPALQYIPALQAEIQSKNPRQEGVWDMLTFAFCPIFKWNSFTTVISLIDILAFFLCVIYLPKTPGPFWSFHNPSLVTVGGSYAYATMNFNHLHRLWTPALLHGFFSHLTGNMMIQIIAGNLLESFIGWQATALLYFFSTPTASIFTILSYDMCGIGASGAIYGLIGGCFGLFFVRYESLKMIPFIKTRLIVLTLVSVASQVLIAYTAFTSRTNVDVGAHFGGFIGGFFLAMILIPPESSDLFYKQRNTIRSLGLMAYLIILLGGLYLFFTQRTPIDVYDMYSP